MVKQTMSRFLSNVVNVLMWIVAHRERGSWLWTLPPLSLGIIALFCQFPHRHAGVLLHVFTPPILLGIVWLAIGSYLIDSALSRASAFEKHARSLLGEQAAETAGADRQRERLMASGRHLIASLFFILPVGSSMVILLVSEDRMLGFLYPVVLTPILYYAGFGIWGSWVISNAVKGVCRETRGHLDLFHQDNLAGLAFVRRYSDATSAIMMSGLLVIPMATFMLTQGYRMASKGSWIGLTVILLSGLAVLIWLGATSFIGIQGRLAISRALTELRDRTLREIVSEREQLRKLGATAPMSRTHREREETAALRLPTGFILGSGAWREILQFHLGVATALATVILQSWLTATQ